MTAVGVSGARSEVDALRERVRELELKAHARNGVVSVLTMRIGNELDKPVLDRSEIRGALECFHNAFDQHQEQ